MFSLAPPDTLNHLATLRPDERGRLHSRGLAQAVTDQQDTQGLLGQFADLWHRVRHAVQDLVDLPEALRAAAADMVAARQTAIDAGDSETASQAETLYADILAHEDTANQVAAKVQQYRDTWNTIAASLAGPLGSLADTVESWWLAAKRAIGLGALPLVPVALLVAAVAALGFVAVTGLAVLAWWQTTAATIQGVKSKALPASALGGGGLFSGVSSTLMWGVGGIVALAVLVTLSGGRR